MRMYRCKTEGFHLTARGSEAVVNIDGPPRDGTDPTAGSVVDVDQVIGVTDDRPVTLEQAIEPYLEHFEPVTPTPSLAVAALVETLEPVSSQE